MGNLVHVLICKYGFYGYNAWSSNSKYATHEMKQMKRM